MIQQQRLEDAIDHLNQGNFHRAKTFKSLKVVVKALYEYTTNPQMLPPSTFIPCTLFSVPDRFHELLKLPNGALLEQEPKTLSYNLLLKLYLKSVLKLAMQSQEEINHIVVEGMSRSILFLLPYPKIAKKWVKCLVDLWAGSVENLNVCLRCHLALNKYLSSFDDNSFMWGLRRLYVGYFEACKQVSWKNFEHINFMINSFCQFAKLNIDRTYYVMFGYLRSIALEIDKFHKTKSKQKVNITTRLFSNQFLNCFKLFANLVYRVESDQITPLVYPLCEVMCSYERITQSAEYLPLKLHLLEFQLKIMENLHIYIPHSFELISKLISSPVFLKKISKKSEKVEANIQIGYKLSKSELGQAHLLNQLFQSLFTKIYMFQAIVSANVGGAEIISRLNRIIKQREFTFSGYKETQREAFKIFREDSQNLTKLRSSMKMKLNEDNNLVKFEKKCKKMNLAGVNKFLELKQEQEQVLKQKLKAENEQDSEQEEPSQQDSIPAEDPDEVDSGWEQASEGASEFEFEQAEQEQSEGKMEEVSYEGDPEDVDNAIQAWEEEQWDSQNDLEAD